MSICTRARLLVDLTIEKDRYKVERIKLDPDPIIQLDITPETEGSILKDYPLNCRVKLIVHYTDASLDKKKVIRKFEKGLDVVLNINPIVFKRLEHFGNSEIEQIGIIAQELEKVVPEIVNTSKQTIVTKSELINNENTGKVERKILEEKTIDDFKTYTPEALHFILINAIKELSAKNKELEERIIALENK